jgi:Lsr2
MSQQLTVTLVDDIDGSAASQTVGFGFEGRSYEIDLSDDNSARLRDLMSPYVKAARRSRRSTTPQSPRDAADREHAAEIRTWARAHGHKVSNRGRIPVNIVQAYEADR